MQQHTGYGTSNQKKFAFNWSRMVTDKQTFKELQNLCRAAAGVVMLDPSGTATFVSEVDLKRAREGEEEVANNKAIIDLLDKAKGVTRSPYNPTTDVVFILDSALSIVETLSDRQRVVARAWWARLSPRSIRKVNLEDTDDELLRFALG